MGFVHLRLHTEYSLIDSVVRVPELVNAVAEAGMAAVAVTDQSNLFAMGKFYREALARGVKPIVGVDLTIRHGGERQQASKIAPLCQAQTGYRHVPPALRRPDPRGPQPRGPLVDP